MHPMTALTTVSHAGAKSPLSAAPGESGEPLTFSELGELWLPTQRHIKASTRAGYECMLRLQISRFIGDRPVRELSVADMQDLVAGMENAGYQPSTIAVGYGLTTTVLDDAVRQGLLASNPARLLRARERPKVTPHPIRILSPSEISRLLAASGEPYRTVFAVAIFAGLRSGEVRGLQWQDLDFENGYLRVRRQAQRGSLVPPKTPSAVRAVVLVDPLPTILSNYQANQDDTGPERLLFSTDGKLFLGDRLNDQLRRTLERSRIPQHPGEPPLRFHDLRHACASILIAARADVAFVARQLGHASPATTLRIYAHLFDEAANIDRVRSYVNGHFANLTETDEHPLSTGAGASANRGLRQEQGQSR